MKNDPYNKSSLVWYCLKKPKEKYEKLEWKYNIDPYPSFLARCYRQDLRQNLEIRIYHYLYNFSTVCVKI